MLDTYESCAEYYDFGPVYQQRKDKDFYLTRALEAGGPILEMGCGSGRVLLPIARAGLDITGLDASPAMLELCRVGLRAAGLNNEIHLGDMRSFDLGKKFTLITIPFRPFQHLLDTVDQIACLESVRRHLAPGGKLIFDVFDPKMDAIVAPDGPEIVEFDFVANDGRAMQRSVRRLGHDRPRQVLHLELIFRAKDGDREMEVRRVTPLTMRYFFRFEVEHLLARCGFAVLELLGDFDGSAVGAAPKELIFVAAARS